MPYNLYVMLYREIMTDLSFMPLIVWANVVESFQLILPEIEYQLENFYFGEIISHSSIERSEALR